MPPSKDGEGFPSTTTAAGPVYNDLGWMTTNARGYTIKEEPYGTKRKLRVIHIGAGASGITFAKFLEERLENVELQIYEKNADVGGTWLENRYPGCACDIPSASYQFTWDRNPYWSQYYSESPEIWAYFKSVVDKHGLMRYVKLQHSVVGAYWKAEESIWEVHVRRPDGTEFVDTCNVLVNGGGILNNWKWPEIRGLHSFKGVLQHSARYDPSTDLNGKRVAVIGIGSSGIQIISKIASQVKQLYAWVKSPTWITAGFAQRFAGPNGGNFHYTPEQQKRFAENPQLFLKYSKMIESELNQRFKFILNGTPEAEGAREFAKNEMAQKLGSSNPELLDAIIPKDFGVGCRRPTPGNGFLEALSRDNVHVFTDTMSEITPTGFIDAEGNEYEVDVIICATGFNTSWIPRFPVEANGHSIAKMWAKEPSSYISLGVPHMPNYFMMGGPYGPLGHGSFLPILETLAGNIIQCVQKMQKDHIKSLTPKAEIAEQLKEHAALFLQRTAWTSGCSSWFKQGRVDGPLPMFPGSRLIYMDLLATPRFEDYEIEYCNPLNMFEFLGNGFATREFDGRDLSYYLGLVDGDDHQIDLEGDLHGELSDLVHS
ncbi:hypothetical protein LTR99_004490 [Exophiala xenobiotica]|uniref:Uncharacterized protein n=1 Tax=Vermiconidia calcicola TaxID=1690605 RepID=A0AAV9QEG0_9PEZI|nr:hypothetical protein LTR96_001401 [Exophiala xenobiotica]KAK5539770.1 hypothetical protein LTR25_003475 [Vermiconidia calcicola]KAK5541718.1 hypothetical protein LTR23_005569 [Chaetothyriales sp. CCFEE 6169]KAK5304034.1 hypothetical protein LTR99_004490 [Exophiala xenobiotica]KAK5338644.1 hypothetical protein LTR98_005044 [Exophiala xenobiotica]